MKLQIPLTVSDSDTVSLKIAKVFWHAANLLERDGWAQGCARDEHGKRCTVGALMYSMRELEVLHVEEVFEGTWGAAGHFIDKNVADWNDAEGNTAENVISRLRRISVAVATSSSWGLEDKTA